MYDPLFFWFVSAISLDKLSFFFFSHLYHLDLEPNIIQTLPTVGNIIPCSTRHVCWAIHSHPGQQAPSGTRESFVCICEQYLASNIEFDGVCV